MNNFDDPVHARMVVERDSASATDNEDSDGDVPVLVDPDVRDRGVPESPHGYFSTTCPLSLACWTKIYSP